MSKLNLSFLRRLCSKTELTKASKSASVAVEPESQRDPLDTTFNNPIASFKSKKTSELIRALLVYQICSINWIVDNNMMLMKVARTIMGKYLFGAMMRATFYGQFVAGADQHDIQPTLERLRSFGVKSIIDYSVEEDISEEEAKEREVSALGIGKEPEQKDASVSEEGQAGTKSTLKQFAVEKEFADRRYKVMSARTYFYLNEATCEKNMEAFMRSIEAIYTFNKGSKSSSGGGTGLVAIKVTALGRPQLLLQLSEVIMQARQYMSKLDGTGGNVMTHHKTREELQRYFGDHQNKPEVKEFLNKITSDTKGVVHLFPWSLILDKDVGLSESFRIPDPKTGQMRRLISQISRKEEEQFRNTLRRLKQIIMYAIEADVRLMVDAEQTYFQPAISRITLEMMNKYNKEKCYVYNTYQCYLKDTYREVVTDIEQARRQGFHWGAKLVRGAYIDQERARAAAMGYEDPTCESFEHTTASYHKCLKKLFEARNEGQKNIQIMVASHNEVTVRYALELMDQFKVKPEDRVLCFGQLLGMCDNITFPLGQAGYSAYKYVPYGPIDEVLPYLSRRASENRGFLEKIKKEKRLLMSEVMRRARTGQLRYVPQGNYMPA